MQEGITTNSSEAKNLIARLQNKLTAINNIQSDIQFKSDVSEAIADGFQQIWSTRGSAIGADWDGHDLVRTGRLRNSLINPSRLDMRVIGNTLIISGGTPYASYVNDSFRFLGITNTTNNMITDAISSYIRKTINSSTTRSS